MIKFQFAEIVNEDGSVRRLRYPLAAKYREGLKENLGHLAGEVKNFPDEPSHLNFYSTQLNRHLRTGETPTSFLPRSITDCWCPRWGCRGSLRCVASAPGAPYGALSPREHARPVEPTCCESWGQRGLESDQQLHLVKRVVVEPRGLY